MAVAEHRAGDFLRFFDDGRNLLARISRSGRLYSFSLLAIRLAGTPSDHQRVGQAFLHGDLRDSRAVSSPGRAQRQHDHGRGDLAAHLSHRQKTELSIARARSSFSSGPADSVSAFV